uniref:7TM_GPCR_Srx domain-containing protein n=1 Tax=Panagrellus redivivus TaxID=6233 RepID=A0A7E4UQZ3_PANRE
MHYPVFSYAYIDTGFNYENIFIDLPMNSLGSLICSVLYIWVFIYVHKTSKATSEVLKTHANAKRVKEVRYAVQFAGCSVLFFLCWMTFRVFPLTLPKQIPQLFSITTLCLIWHCTANSLIFIIFNHEFKNKYFRRGMTSTVSKVVSVAHNTAKSSSRQK